MRTKECFKCGKVLLLSEFYKHPEMRDGHLGKCKTCTKADVHANYRKNREHYAEYERRRFKSSARKLLIKEYAHRRRMRYPEKEKAHSAVNRAIRSGKLIRSCCEICGRKGEAHHEDYTKPFDIRWLCFYHHRKLHGQDPFKDNENVKA